MICTANQLNDFHKRATLVLNGLNSLNVRVETRPRSLTSQNLYFLRRKIRSSSLFYKISYFANNKCISKYFRLNFWILVALWNMKSLTRSDWNQQMQQLGCVTFQHISSFLQKRQIFFSLILSINLTFPLNFCVSKENKFPDYDQNLLQFPNCEKNSTKNKKPW